jgi:hypothetical protein
MIEQIYGIESDKAHAPKIPAPTSSCVMYAKAPDKRDQFGRQELACAAAAPSTVGPSSLPLIAAAIIRGARMQRYPVLEMR